MRPIWKSEDARHSRENCKRRLHRNSFENSKTSSSRGVDLRTRRFRAVSLCRTNEQKSSNHPKCSRIFVLVPFIKELRVLFKSIRWVSFCRVFIALSRVTPSFVCNVATKSPSSSLCLRVSSHKPVWTFWRSQPSSFTLIDNSIVSRFIRFTPGVIVIVLSSPNPLPRASHFCPSHERASEDGVSS